MFNSGIKGNHRSNGLNSSASIDQLINDRTHCSTSYKLVNTVVNKDVYNKHESNNLLGNYLDTKVKIEVDDQDVEDKITAHSIIGLSEEYVKSHKSLAVVKPRIKRGSIRATHHETLQRIEPEIDIYNHYQQHWFSASLEKFKLEDRSREERIEITRHEFRRHMQQIMRSNIGQPNKFPPPSQNNKNCNFVNRSRYQTGYNKLVTPKMCEISKCFQAALPCAKHCTMHIMSNSDQVLFDYCTAKFADNTQCSVPVFDITHELPLCPEHARKRDNYKLYQEAKPKKLRKKVKPSAMIRPQKRNKKKRRPIMKSTEISTPSAILDDIPVTEDVEISEINAIEKEGSPEIEGALLELNETEVLDQQAHLLEETDITTVLSTIQVDEFSDFFAVNRNGDYEPSREETEELEKALAAVDNDVKSLEKLSQTHGLLDSLLDDNALNESLVQIPEMFHNGYTPCGDSMVAQTSSFLLPIEPHSHS